MILRDYQIRAVSAIRELFQKGNRRVCVCLPTGAGKTAIAVSIIEKCKGRVYFIVPRLELTSQTSSALDMYPHGFCMSGKPTDTDNVLICSLETLKRRMDTMLDPKLIFFDEAHTNYDAQMAIIKQWPDAFVIGLTATPERQSGASLKRVKTADCGNRCELIRKNDIDGALKATVKPNEGWAGIYDVLYNAESIKGLQQQGFLSGLNYMSFEKADWNQKPGAQEVTNDADIEKNIVMGDIIKTWEQYGKGHPSLGFTPTISLAEKVVELFSSAGYNNWAVIHGGMKTQKRQELIARLKRNELNLVNAALLTYGFDAPEAQYAFSIRHIFSRPLWVQMVGRILRPYPGKREAVFVDHGGSVYNFDSFGKYGPDKKYPIFFEDPTPEWDFAGSTKYKCMFNLDIHCDKTKCKPPCIHNPYEKCGAALFWGKEECLALKREPRRACYWKKNVEYEGRPREDGIKIVDARIVTINKSQAWALAEQTIQNLRSSPDRDDSVRLLCDIAKNQCYKPMWVVHMLKDNSVLTPHDLYVIGKSFGYKSGWAAYKAKELLGYAM